MFFYPGVKFLGVQYSVLVGISSLSSLILLQVSTLISVLLFSLSQ